MRTTIDGHTTHMETQTHARHTHTYIYTTKKKKRNPIAG